MELNHQSTGVSAQRTDRNEKADNRILATALNLKNDDHLPVILVTKDTNLRIKADAVGLHAEDFESETITHRRTLFRRNRIERRTRD